MAAGTADLVQSSLTTALDTVFHDLQSWTVKVLTLLMLVQFLWSNWHLLIGGAELEKVFAKLLGMLWWGGFVFYVFENGADYITKTASFLLQKATGVSGAPFNPTYAIDTGVGVASAMLEALDSSQSILSALNPFPSIMMGLVAVVILATCAVIAFKVLMILVETKIVIALSPISFALLGLDALKDQGLAPLKYLIALAYRIMIIAAILVAMGALGKAIVASFASLPSANDGSIWPPIWASAISFSLLFGLAWKADSIAAMLASGSSNMSPGDAAAVGAVAGAAAAAAVAGGMSAGAGASEVAKGLPAIPADMKSSMSNDSPAGAGGKEQPIVGTPPRPSPKAPELSKAQVSADRMERNPDGGGASMPPSSTGCSASGASSSSASGGAGNGSASPSSPLSSSASANRPLPGQEPKPPSSSPTAASGSNSSGSGSGESAGIGGNSSATDQKLDKLMESMGQSKEPSLGDHLGTLNDHLANEQAAVHVSVNTNHEH